MCGHKATKPGHLKQHKLSVHIGRKYPCDICVYQATKPGSLKKHKKSYHTDVKYIYM